MSSIIFILLATGVGPLLGAASCKLLGLVPKRPTRGDHVFLVAANFWAWPATCALALVAILRFGPVILWDILQERRIAA